MKRQEIIYAYTRKQAIEDGFQMKLTGKLAKMAKEAGYKWPIYTTDSVIRIIENAIDKGHGDLHGIFWDILMCSRYMKRKVSDDLIKFKVKIGGRYKEFYMQAGPTDIEDPAPCLTLMREADL